MSKNIKKIIFIMALAIIMTALVSVSAFAARDAVGDLNRDGAKDENDAVHLLYYTYFSNKYEVDQPCDYNGDGVVDDKDALYLLYNTYFPNKYYICEHDADKWSVKEVVAPTCKEKGYTVMICECGEEEITNYTDITDKHIWGEPNYDNAATCLENGYITETCTVCDKVNTTQQQAIGHDWTKGSCTEAKTCENCGAEEAAKGHIFGTEPVESVPATCKGGYNLFKCENCDETTKVDLEPVDHAVKEDAWKFTREDAVEGAKCTYVYVEQNICLVCGETVERSSEPFIKHNETTSVTEATCVTKGEKIVSCKDCGTEIKRETIAINTNHNWVEDTEKSTATVTAYKCDAEGCTATKTAAKLSADGKVDIGTAEEVELDNGAAIIPDEKTKEQLGGTNVSVSVDTVDADEIGLGEDEKALLDGAPIYNLEMADENDKPITNFDGTMTVRLPYELSEGDDPDCIIIWYIKDDGRIEYYEAKYINGYAVFETSHFSYYTVTRMTPAQRCNAYGHNYETTLVPATCVTGGYTLDICTRCGDKVVSDPTDALGHDWEVAVTKAAGCTEKGTETHTCKRCDIDFEKSIGALGHSYKAEEELGVTDRYVAPSCTAKGEHYMVCERCDKEYKEDLAQLEHEYDTEEVEADCEKGGHKKNKCKHCGDEYESDHTKPNGHAYGKDGKCGHCKKVCAHEYKYGVCTHCNCEKEKPNKPDEPKPEDPDHKHTLNVTFEFINEDLRYCELGVVITEKCTTCDYENTFTTFDHYSWEVEVDLSAYDICESHAIHYRRCACVEGEFSWIEELEFDGDQFVIEGGMGIQCKECAFKIIVTVKEEETDCYEMAYQKIEFLAGEESIHVLEAMMKETYHTLEDAKVKFDKNGSSCTDGVTVKGTCSVCGEAVEYKLYGHYTVLTENYDLAQYGACEEHHFIVSQCPCGVEKYAYSRGFDSAHHSSDPFGNQTIEYYCDTCGVSVECIRRAGSVDQNCVLTRTEIYNVKVNGEIKESVTIVTSSLSHDMKITEIDFAEGSSSCKEGLIVTETCVRCGVSETYSTYGHRYEREALDLSGYKVCDHHNISVGKCIGCGEIDYIDYSNFDYWSDGRAYCGRCDLYVIEEEIYSEKDENCELEITRKIAVCYGEEILAEIESVGYRMDHVIEITYELAEGATKCEEGLIITEKCADCGWEATYDQYDHYIQEMYFVFPEGAVCDYHNVYVSCCMACDYINNYGFEGGLNGRSEETENGYKDTLFCSECNLTIVDEYSMIGTDNPCEIITSGTVSIFAGDELFYEGYMESIWMRHEYDVTVSLREGATTCEEGIVIVSTCKNCEESFTRYEYGHYTERTELDLSEYGACEYHSVNVSRCLCCGKTENLNFDGLTRRKVDGRRAYVCSDEACDLIIYETTEYGMKNEYCEVRVVNHYDVVYGEEFILDFNDDYYMTDHDYDCTFEFMSESGSCEDGYIVYYTCKECGASEKYEEWGHYTYKVETVYLSDYGHKCGTGEVGIYSCPCGYNWHQYISDQDTFTGNWKYEEIDGVEYEINAYICMDCGFEYERRIATVKDEFCNANHIAKVVIHGETVSEYVFSSDKEHRITEKELPDESYMIENEDGSYLEVIAREEYCEDCFASIRKYVITVEYSADRTVATEKREYYEYVALNEKETIAVLTATQVNTYHKAEYVLGEGYIYACDTSENYYYDENGNVTSWEKYEYIYENGDHCNYTVKITMSDGGTRIETIENEHRDYIGKYVLVGGGESCTDGVQYVYYCSLCGNEAGRYEEIHYYHEIESNYLMESERIDFRDFGAACESYIVIYSCACGEKIKYSIDGECDFDGYHDWEYDENGIRHNYDFYTCAVTHPETCGFKFCREIYYTSDSECNEIAHVNFYIDINETNDSYQKKLSYEYKTGSKNHNNIDIVETTTYERYYCIEKCLTCGILLSETEIKDNIKTHTYYEYNNIDGTLSYKSVEKYIYPVIYYNDKMLLSRSEYYDNYGNIIEWSQQERTYPYADEGNYCYYEYTNSSSYDKNNSGSGENHSFYNYGDSCTIAPTETFCSYCDYVEESWGGYGYHDFYYDYEKGVYVCYRCELESLAGGNGDVIFEDVTMEEGNGSEYVLGWINNYDGSYIWSVALVVDGSDEFIYLDDIKVFEDGDYRLRLDANAVFELAQSMGYDPCQYMVRVAFVPTDAYGELDYAITLDPHVFVEDPDNTVIPDDCSEYTFAYKCAFCDETKTETVKGHHFSGRTHTTIGYNEAGLWTVSEEYIRTCTLCGKSSKNSSYTTYYPNGDIFEEVGDGYRTVYEYDYDEGLRYEYFESIYDGEVQRFESRKYDMTSDGDYLLYFYCEEADGYIEECEYMWIDGERYTLSIREENSGGYWYTKDFEYDFDNDIMVMTYKSSYVEEEVTKYYISTGELITE